MRGENQTRLVSIVLNLLLYLFFPFTNNFISKLHFIYIWFCPPNLSGSISKASPRRINLRGPRHLLKGRHTLAARRVFVLVKYKAKEAEGPRAPWRL